VGCGDYESYPTVPYQLLDSILAGDDLAWREWQYELLS
jgi:hypothetical protein